MREDGPWLNIPFQSIDTSFVFPLTHEIADELNPDRGKARFDSSSHRVIPGVNIKSLVTAKRNADSMRDHDWVREQKSSNGLTKDRHAFRWSFNAGETESVPSVGGYPSCFRGGIGQQERVAAM